MIMQKNLKKFTCASWNEPKAVTIPRSETTLGAWAIFNFCVFLTDVSISCSMVLECSFTCWTLEDSNAQGVYVRGWI